MEVFIEGFQGFVVDGCQVLLDGAIGVGGYVVYRDDLSTFFDEAEFDPGASVVYSQYCHDAGFSLCNVMGIKYIKYVQTF